MSHPPNTPPVPAFSFDEIPKGVYGAMEGAVAFAEDLLSHRSAQQPEGQFCDGKYTLWQWIYDEFAEHWGGFPGMWQLCINAGWACQKFIESLDHEWDGEFAEMVERAVLIIDRDMIEGRLNESSFDENYFVRVWADALAGKASPSTPASLDKAWTVILDYEESESENEAGYATSVQAPTWQAAVHAAIQEFLDHDEWGNGEEPEEDPAKRKVAPGSKLRLLDVFPGRMQSLSSNQLYVVTLDGAMLEEEFDALAPAERESLTKKEPEDDDC